MADKIEFQIDDPRSIEWIDSIAFTEGNQRSIIKCMARYLLVNGKKLPQDQAVAYLMHCPAIDAQTLTARFDAQVRETVLPLANATPS